MGLLDELVLGQLESWIFAPDRVRKLLAALIDRSRNDAEQQAL